MIFSLTRYYHDSYPNIIIFYDYGGNVYKTWQEGNLTDIPGVGKAIAEKIDELFTTGQLEFLDKLSKEVPPSLADLLEVPDLGPKKVALFWQELGITNLAGLDAAARAGDLRSLPGMGEKSEAKIIAGIEALSRRTTRTPLWKAWPVAQDILTKLSQIPGVETAVAAGLSDDKIMVDPGIGFGKSVEGNLTILKRLPELSQLRMPILVGASRKAFIGAALDLPVQDRLEGSLAVAAYASAQGAHVIRAHDVAATARAVRMIDAIRQN